MKKLLIISLFASSFNLIACSSQTLNQVQPEQGLKSATLKLPENLRLLYANNITFTPIKPEFQGIAINAGSFIHNNNFNPDFSNNLINSKKNFELIIPHGE